MTNRLSYQDSFRSLQKQDWLKPGNPPPIPAKPPAYDDENLGIEFFRTWLDGAKGADFRNLTLPRTYFGRSQINNISFENSDLTESVANWNDFIDVDFSRSDLTRLDLRGCQLLRTNFTECKLTGADLRCCSFVDCNFKAANLTGTKLTRACGDLIALSQEQQAVVDWQEEDGDEPDGG
jgi:uncharacterized protein YjbI with pentapeptide repeats